MIGIANSVTMIPRQRKLLSVPRPKIATCGYDNISCKRNQQRPSNSAGNPFRVLREGVSVTKLD